jgi:protein-S-isoprenylcysteine O-methyltransferase Ste14
MWPLLISYGLIGCFFIAESLLRQGALAKSFQPGQADRGSTPVIGAAFGLALLAMLLAPLLNYWFVIGHLSSQVLAWGGIVLMLTGLVLRIWAARVLGAFYTRTLRTTTDQHLITQGPYHLIRHPGYLGMLLLWLGAGCATSNWITALIIVAPMVGAYWYRVRAEEAMLADTFPQEYQNYASHSWRLIPFLY